MKKWLITFIIDKIIMLIKYWWESRQANKKAKQVIKSIMVEHKNDPIKRAIRINEFLMEKDR